MVGLLYRALQAHKNDDQHQVAFKANE